MDKGDKWLIEQIGIDVPECLRESPSEPLEAAVAAKDSKQVGRA
jgi:hypothetical protein